MWRWSTNAIFAALGAKCTVLDYSEMKDEQLYRESIKNNWGIQFSHTIEEQIGGQLRAGFILTDIYQDTNGFGRLHEFNVPTYYATRQLKYKKQLERRYENLKPKIMK